MSKTFLIELEGDDLGQVLDGLRCRADAWRETARYLQTGESPEDFFIPEECLDGEEAEGVAADYERIIAEIVRQREEQGMGGEANIDASSRVGRKAESSLRTPKAAVQSGFGVFINTIGEGEVSLYRDEKGRPYFFETRREAEEDIIDVLMIRLRECLEGEREFDDAISVEEYILPVERLADGSLRDEWGREHG
jgi:hypothetical protein